MSNGMTKRELNLAVINFTLGFVTVLAIFMIVMLDRMSRPPVSVVNTQLATQTFQSCVKDLSTAPNHREYVIDIADACQKAALQLSTTLPGTEVRRENP